MVFIFIGDELIVLIEIDLIVLWFCVCFVLIGFVVKVLKERMDRIFNVVIVVLIFMIFILLNFFIGVFVL